MFVAKAGYTQHLASHGSTMQHITRKELDKFQAIFPINENEQTQIAAVLHAIDRAIEQTEAMIAKRQRIKTGLMQDLLTKGIDENGNVRSEATHEFKDSPLGSTPVEWEVKKLSQLSNLIIDGTHFTPAYTEHGIPFLRVTDINEDEINFKSIRYISEKEHILLRRRCKPEKGDILYSKNGTVGISKLIDWDWEFSIFVSLALLKLKHELLNPQFAKIILTSQITKKQIFLRSKQGTVINLHLEEIRELNIPAPLIIEQERITILFIKTDESIQNETMKLRKLTAIKVGLMQDLLTSNVRVTALLNDRANASR